MKFRNKEELVAYWLVPYIPPVGLRVEDFHRNTAVYTQEIQVTCNMVVQLASGLRLFLTTNRTVGKDEGFEQPMDGVFTAQVLTFECESGVHQMQDCESCRTKHASSFSTFKGEIKYNELAIHDEEFAEFLAPIYEELTRHEVLEVDALEGIVASICESEALYDVFNVCAKDKLREYKGNVFFATPIPPKSPLKTRLRDNFRIAKLWL